MRRPISSPVRLRVADYLHRSQKLPFAEALIAATKLITDLDAAGVDVVMPGWVPVTDEEVAHVPSPAARPRRWEDLAKTIDIDVMAREPWRPYNA